jgi:hypothetical protein
MQTMQYVLKTGFGESEESYGSTESSLNSGLGQGSRASPLALLLSAPLQSIHTVEWGTAQKFTHSISVAYFTSAL